MSESVEVQTAPPVKSTQPYLLEQVTEAEVRSLIEPESWGVTKDIDLIQANDTPLGDIVSRYNDTQKWSSDRLDAEYAGKLEKAVAPIREELGKLVVSEELIKALAQFEEIEAVSSKDISSFLNNLDKRGRSRALMILRHGIDPELIPLALEIQNKRGGADGALLAVQDVFRASEHLRLQLASMLTDKSLMKEFREASHDTGRGYSDELKDKVGQIIDTFDAGAGKLGNLSSEVIVYARRYLAGRLFDEMAVYPPHDKDTIESLHSSLLRLTADVYFRHHDRDPGWSLHQNAGLTATELIETPLIKQAWQHARSVEAGKYIVALYKVTDKILKTHFPEIYIDSHLDRLRLEDPMSKLHKEEEVSEGADKAGGGEGEGLVVIESGTIMKARGLAAFEEETVSAFTAGVNGKEEPVEIKAKRKVIDTLTMAHELAHAMFDSTVHGRHVEVDFVDLSVKRALTEGFAVLTELLFIDLLRENPALLNLDDSDINALKQLKWGRLHSLRKKQNEYSEGTFRILHKVFKKAAGPPQERDVHQGLRAVREFIEAIDGDKILQVERSDAEYRKLLQEGDPNKWRQWLSNGGFSDRQ
ncbi:hypothetical protein IID21_04890 [Patescibacteria group bacterium]|nr:hypothetical protein [Patescibacteria group bacterium]